MKGDIVGVRIIPPAVEFTNYQVGVPVRLQVRVQNISEVSKWIRFHGIAESKDFDVKYENPKAQTPPGLEASAEVLFNGRRVPDDGEGFIGGRLVVAVEDGVVEIPVAAFPPTPIFKVEGNLDFGNILAGGRVLKRKITLSNVGGSEGHFEIFCPPVSSGASFGVSPAAGTLAAGEEITIKFEILTNEQRNIRETIKIRLAGSKDPVTIPVSIDVVKRDFGILTPATGATSNGPTSLIDFGSVFFGSDSVVSGFIYNNSPESFSFVCLLDDSAVGQETGSDLTQPVAQILASRAHEDATPLSTIAGRSPRQPLTKVVHVFPSEGTVGAFQKIPVHFIFSPRGNPPPIVGFHALAAANFPRRDFALFLRLEIVGSSGGFSTRSPENFVEIAVKGTALPIGLQVTPPEGNANMDFGACQVNEQTQSVCKFHNGSPLLPLSYSIRSVAHFNVTPKRGKILPRKDQDVQIAFVPNQIGTFTPELMIDIMGPVIDVSSLQLQQKPFHEWLPPKISPKPIFTHVLQLSGVCVSTTSFPPPKFNPGIVPLVTNETGLCVERGGRDNKEVNNGKGPRMAVLQASKMGLATGKADETAKVAFPNDVARSIRPGCRDEEEYRTIFKKLKRYTYVDPDYQFTKEEREEIEKHKHVYQEYIQNLRKDRLRKENLGKYDKYLNSTEIGLVPAQGLKPPDPDLDELVEELGPVFKPKLPHLCKGCDQELHAKEVGPKLPTLMSLRALSDAEASTTRCATTRGENAAVATATTPAADGVADGGAATAAPGTGASGLQAVPTSMRQVKECGAKLTPSQLHKVVVGPPVVDFGKVCLRSNATKELTVTNLLDAFVLVEVVVDCRELRHSSPLAQVIPPRANANIPLVFESAAKGTFHRPIKYMVNGHHCLSFAVRAEVVPVTLTLSTSELTVTPSPGLPVDAGSRGVVTLINEFNLAAKFTWTPIVGDYGTAFSIRPATGTVEPFSSLDCEVVFHPSFSAPEEGEFSLQVVGAGSASVAAAAPAQQQQLVVPPLKLRCIARNGILPQRWICSEIQEKRKIKEEAQRAAKEKKAREKEEKETMKREREKERRDKRGKKEASSEKQREEENVERSNKNNNNETSHGDETDSDVDDDIENGKNGVNDNNNNGSNKIKTRKAILVKTTDISNLQRSRQKIPVGARTNCGPREALWEGRAFKERPWHCLTEGKEEKEEQEKDEEEGGGRSRGGTRTRKRNQGTSVEFVDRRVNFGNIPVNLPSTQTALLKNTGQFHAYFKITNPNPIPGLLVTPVTGMVPVGGTVEIRVQFRPASNAKFDTKFDVEVRGVRTPLTMRVGGTICAPEVEILTPLKPGTRPPAPGTPAPPVTLNYAGVACGSMHALPITVVNKGETRAVLEFDLVKFKAFQLDFGPLPRSLEAKFEANLDVNFFRLRLDPLESVEGKVVFQPKDIASYNFVLPCKVNAVPVPPPLSPTKVVATPATPVSRLSPLPLDAGLAALNTRVTGTALRRPLIISNTKVEFDLPSTFYEIIKGSGIGETKEIEFTNCAKEAFTFSVDLGASDVTGCDAAVPSPLEAGIFRFLHADGTPFLGFEPDSLVGASLKPGEKFVIKIMFCPEMPGKFYCKVPLYIRSDPTKKSKDRPYTFLEVSGIQRRPSLTFDPLALNLQPVPLATPIVSEFKIIATGYNKKSPLKVDIPSVTPLDDGEPISVLSISFPRGSEISICGEASEGRTGGGRGVATLGPCVLPVKITFSSERPVSFSAPIVFTDAFDRKYVLPVSATADNSLLSCYSFLALHQRDYKVVCEQGATLRGFGATSGAGRAGGGGGVASATASDSSSVVTPASTVVGEAVLVPCDNVRDDESLRSTSTTQVTHSGSTSGETKGGASTPVTSSTTTTRAATRRAVNDITERSLGSALFPDDDESEESLFQAEVLNAVQRWVSSQGAPSSPPQPLSVPQSLRSSTSGRRLMDERGTKKKRNDAAPNSAFQTIYDVVSNLVGKAMPGIPKDKGYSPNYEEMVKELQWRNSTLLVFLRNQGGAVCGLKPEYLLEPEDYYCWMNLMKEEGKVSDEQILPERLFQSVSKRAWTDLLLQTIKALVLARVTPRSFKNLSDSVVKTLSVPALPSVNPDPQGSNVYGVSERVILAWLNHHFEHLRTNLWLEAPQGPPASRWVVNFEYDLLDSLVLAAAIGAYLPFLKSTHLKYMYTQPKTAEQCLHNALKVVSMLRAVGIDYDIQAIDITDPNPVAMLLLCTHLYQVLPSYLPKGTVVISGSLHQTMKSAVKIVNPVAKALQYCGVFLGHDSPAFSFGKTPSFNISSKGVASIPILFFARFLRPSTSTLVLSAARTGTAVGAPKIFHVTTEVTGIEPLETLQVSSPCYEPTSVNMAVKNPFEDDGLFKVILLEMPEGPSEAEVEAAKRKKQQQKKGKKEEEAPKPPDPGSLMRSFFCRVGSVQIRAQETKDILLTFIPFAVGKKKCSVVFSSEEVGDFIVGVEAEAMPPLPSPILGAAEGKAAALTGEGKQEAEAKKTRISSAAPLVNGAGPFQMKNEEPVRIIYWQCKEDAMVKQNLPVPISNVSREAALISANQQLMAPKEVERRSLTGTLDAAAPAARRLPELFVKQGLLPSDSIQITGDALKGQLFKVSLSSTMYYSAPSTLYIPSPGELRAKKFEDVNLADDTINLPLTVIPSGIGYYPCTVTLSAPGDIRVFQVQTTVNPKGATTELQFSCPLQQQIVQDIPVVNSTAHDWHFRCDVTTENEKSSTCFVGPPALIAKAYQTTIYSLLFKPNALGLCKAMLSLTNEVDGSKYIYNLNGTATPPGALDIISIVCEARTKFTHTLTLPNMSKYSLSFRPECDLPFVEGASQVLLNPFTKQNYFITVNPQMRGEFRGVLAFIPSMQGYREDDEEEESTAQRSGRPSRSELEAVRVWFNLQISVKPPPPEKVLEITCACQKSAILEVGVNNPSTEEVTMMATIEGGEGGLSGESQLTIASAAKGIYQLKYSPVAVGRTRGSLIFQNPEVGEFWYDLVLLATPPAPTTLPHMEAPLGQTTTQILTLTNPTDAVIELTPSCSNPENFMLHIDEPAVVIQPHSSVGVPIIFNPTSLGQVNHLARIAFLSSRIGEWVYIASGTGLLPTEQPLKEISTGLGTPVQQSVTFTNPSSSVVVVDIDLLDLSNYVASTSTSSVSNPYATCNAFKLNVNHNKGIVLQPQEAIQIPVVFAPSLMARHAAKLVLTVRRQDGRNWKYIPPAEAEKKSSFIRSGSGGIRSINWIYPIKGVPVLSPTGANHAAKIETKAREKVEMRLEVHLAMTMDQTNKKGDEHTVSLRPATPPSTAASLPQDAGDVEEGSRLLNHFDFRFEYESEAVSRKMSRAVDVCLVRGYERHVDAGVFVLLFHVAFSPGKPFHHKARLVVDSHHSGGVWTFPVDFKAGPPNVDDIIQMESRGLDVTTSVSFKLSAPGSRPVNFKSHLSGNSAALRVFSVTPSEGALAPSTEGGTSFVVDFSPKTYGKKYEVQLVVETDYDDWRYQIEGVMPKYTKPEGQSSIPKMEGGVKLPPIAGAANAGGAVGDGGDSGGLDETRGGNQDFDNIDEDGLAWGAHPYSSTPGHRVTFRPQRRERNFVRENLTMTSTATSSTFKGASLVQRTL